MFIFQVMMEEKASNMPVSVIAGKLKVLLEQALGERYTKLRNVDAPLNSIAERIVASTGSTGIERKMLDISSAFRDLAEKSKNWIAPVGILIAPGKKSEIIEIDPSDIALGALSSRHVAQIFVADPGGTIEMLDALARGFGKGANACIKRADNPEVWDLFLSYTGQMTDIGRKHGPDCIDALGTLYEFVKTNPGIAFGIADVAGARAVYELQGSLSIVQEFPQEIMRLAAIGGGDALKMVGKNKELFRENPENFVALAEGSMLMFDMLEHENFAKKFREEPERMVALAARLGKFSDENKKLKYDLVHFFYGNTGLTKMFLERPEETFQLIELTKAQQFSQAGYVSTMAEKFIEDPERFLEIIRDSQGNWKKMNAQFYIIYKEGEGK